jgi:hypothetical protein
MARMLRLLLVPVCTLALGVGCSKQSQSPSSPSPAAPAAADLNPDGSNLKVTAPTAQSPINNARPANPPVTFVISNASEKFTTGTVFTYRFRVYNAGGGLVYEAGNVPAGSGTTSHTLPDSIILVGDTTHTWEARAESGGAFGPWSPRASFVAPVSEGYIRGAELYDPLNNGKTVGRISGPVTFIPGVGIRLDTLLSYVSYELPVTLTEGEFSLLVTNMPANTEGTKTKLMAMAKGYDDIVTNDRRMTIEKRGDPPGIIAWRFITHGDQIDTEGAERTFYNFQGHLTYFFQATWRNNFFNVLIREGGVNGVKVYEKGKHFVGRAYDPIPHVIYIGAPIGRTGEDGASVEGAVIRQVWVSANPRPSFASN